MEIVENDEPPRSFALGAGMMAVVPPGRMAPGSLGGWRGGDDRNAVPRRRQYRSSCRRPADGRAQTSVRNHHDGRTSSDRWDGCSRALSPCLNQAIFQFWAPFGTLPDINTNGFRVMGERLQARRLGPAIPGSSDFSAIGPHTRLSRAIATSSREPHRRAGVLVARPQRLRNSDYESSRLSP